MNLPLDQLSQLHNVITGHNSQWLMYYVISMHDDALFLQSAPDSLRSTITILLMTKRSDGSFIIYLTISKIIIMSQLDHRNNKITRARSFNYMHRNEITLRTQWALDSCAYVTKPKPRDRHPNAAREVEISQRIAVSMLFHSCRDHIYAKRYVYVCMYVCICICWQRVESNIIT